MLPTRRPLMICLALLLMTATATAQDHDIRLDRALKVGQTIRATGTATSSMKQSMTMQGNVMPAQETTQQTSGDLDLVIEAIDGKGRATGVRATVRSLTVKGSMGEESLPAGTVFSARVERGEVKFVDLPPATTAQVKDGIEQLLDLLATEAHTDNEMLGTSEKQKISGTWPVNGSLLADSMSDPPMRIGTESTKGTMRLVSVKDALQNVTGTVTIGSIELAGAGLPPNLKVIDSSGSIKVSFDLPVDPDGFLVSKKLEAEVSISIADNPKVEEATMMIVQNMKMVASVRYSTVEGT